MSVKLRLTTVPSFIFIINLDFFEFSFYFFILNKNVKMNAYLKIVCFSMAVVLISGQDINQCFEQDSISCVQKSLYRKAKEFFTKDNIELFSGVSLVKAADRNSRTAKDVIYDQEIDAANDVEGRQSALENFVSDEASDFLTGRSLRVIIFSIVSSLIFFFFWYKKWL